MLFPMRVKGMPTDCFFVSFGEFLLPCAYLRDRAPVHPRIEQFAQGQRLCGGLRPIPLEAYSSWTPLAVSLIRIFVWFVPAQISVSFARQGHVEARHVASRPRPAG